MKIIHVSDTSVFNFDGISTYINELLECACRNGDQALALVPPPLHESINRSLNHSAGIRVFPPVKALCSAGFVFALPRGLHSIFDEFRPDLVWIHTIGPLGLAAARLGRGRYRMVYTKHCFDGELWVKHLQVPAGFQWIFRLAAAVVEGWVAGPASQVLFHFNGKEKMQGRIAGPKSTFIPPPINRRFATEPFHRNLKRKDRLTIGFCGRLAPEKGLEDLFEAAGLYLKSGGKPLDLLLIGDGTAGRQLREKHPDLEVTITGFVDDVIPHLDRLDAFILPSRTETASLSALEAFARNIPIFTRRVGFLGGTERKFAGVHHFDTPAELAGLLREKVGLGPSPTRSVPSPLDDALITFAQLHERVAERTCRERVVERA